MKARSTPSRRAHPLPIRPETEIEVEPTVVATTDGSGQCGVSVPGRKTFDQLDDFKALAGRQFKEGLQQSQAFDRFARWSSESLLQLCNKCGIFHLAP